MFFKYSYLLLSTTIVYTIADTSVKHLVVYFSCPSDDRQAGKTYKSQISVRTKHNIDVGRLPLATGASKLTIKYDKFDSNFIVYCEVSDYSWIHSYTYSYTTNYSDNMLRISNTLPELPDVHYYHEGDIYYLDCQHKVADDLVWIKTDGNGTIHAASRTRTTRLIELFNLTRVDNDMRLYCFRYNCANMPVTYRHRKECVRVILKSVRLQLKIEPLNTVFTKMHVLIAFIILLMIIIFLITIILMLLMKVARRPGVSSSHRSTAPRLEVLYENQNFGQLNMQVDYADLELDPAKDALSPRYDPLYTDVDDARTEQMTKKNKWKCGF